MCARLSDAEWAVIAKHALLAASQIFPELFESACRVWQIFQEMSSIWWFSAQHCKELEADTLGIFEDQAATWVHFMWQHDSHAIARFIKEYMNRHDDPGLRAKPKQPYNDENDGNFPLSDGYF